MTDRPDRPRIVFARPPKRSRRPGKPAAPLAISRVVYAPKRRAGAVLPSVPEITEEELARRADAADELMQEIKRRISEEKDSGGANKLPEPGAAADAILRHLRGRRGRLLHHDKALSLEVLDQLLGRDLGHEAVRMMVALPAVKLEREGKRLLQRRYHPTRLTCRTGEAAAADCDHCHGRNGWRPTG